MLETKAGSPSVEAERMEAQTNLSALLEKNGLMNTDKAVSVAKKMATFIDGPFNVFWSEDGVLTVKAHVCEGNLTIAFEGSSVMAVYEDEVGTVFYTSKSGVEKAGEMGNSSDRMLLLMLNDGNSIRLVKAFNKVDIEHYRKAKKSR